MTEQGEKKIAVKAAELMDAIKEELQAEKQEAIQYVQEVKDAAHDAVEETKEKFHKVVESTKKNLQGKAEELILRKDEVVEDTAETLKKAIDHAKCAMTRDQCKGDTVVSGEAGTDKESDSDKVAPV